MAEVGQSHDGSRGWTLLEAMKRTADPAIWQRWLDAHAAYETARTPIPSSPGCFIRKAPHIIKELRKAADLAFMTAWRDVLGHLESKSLTAVGSRNGPSEPPTPIFAGGWKGINILNLKASIVRERYGARTKIYNVSVFPLIHAPDGARTMIGLSLSDAFRKFVLDDPEVIACGKLSGISSRHRPVFQEGQLPGLVDFKWPIGITSKELASCFLRPMVYFVGSPIPKPSTEEERAAEVLSDRWKGLTNCFASSRVTVIGTFSATGLVQPIHSLEWRRTNQAVDVQNSDLLEMQNSKWSIRWSGLQIVETSNQPLVARATSHPTQRRKGHKAAVVEAVLAKAGIDLGQDPRGPKTIAGVIGSLMPDPPKTQEQLGALAKMIERMRK